MEHSSRRQFLIGAGALSGALALGEGANLPARAAKKPPTSPVSLARSTDYDLATLTARMERMFDQLGGIRKQVSGKTVAVKVNLTGDIGAKFDGKSAGQTYQTHPATALALATLLDRAGAKRIRFVDCTYRLGEIEELLAKGGWEMDRFRALKASVEWENTRNLGKGKQYATVKVPWGGSLFPAYLVNHSYVECDYYISLAKMKNHFCAGVTLSIKNNFGVTPNALYGQAEHDEKSTNARVAMFHEGKIAPSAGVPKELDPRSSRATTYRVPRHTVDSLGIRPIDLAIIDGIETTSGGEGPWIKTLKYLKPDVLVAGKNAVCTDAVATAVMGYNPLAPAKTECFPGDNHLTMAMELGLGTADPRQIDIRGLPLAEARFPFRWEPDARGY